jgi:serine/threonine-protein kinase
MAPEQERGDTAAIGVRTDVFGLGALLRFLLQAPPAEPGSRPRVPRPLRAICERALADRPDARYDDASALAADIDRFMAGRAVLAYHENPWERLARFYVNYRPAILLIAAYLLMRLLFMALR